jgi:hypothetical protein
VSAACTVPVKHRVVMVSVVINVDVMLSFLDMASSPLRTIRLPLRGVVVVSV